MYRTAFSEIPRESLKRLQKNHSKKKPEAVLKTPRSARHPPAYVVKLERGCPDNRYIDRIAARRWL